jgi:FAD/FMN-containing dehydrogenase
MIDLSPMKETFVDPTRRIARAQTGLKLGEFDRETQKYGLVTPLGVATTTGIAGLTLGGGYGWLVGKYGLSCDNVSWIELVTADGRILECSAEENSELFWGMRGAGANLGIATRIEYRLHPLTHIYGGAIFHSLSPEVMRFYAEFARSQPDELTTLGAATIGPNGQPAFVIAACHCGSQDEGEKLIKPIRQFASPLLDMIQVRPYLELQSLFDADLRPGRRYYNKSHNVTEFTPGLIDTVMQYTATMSPYPSMIGFQQLHGAASRVPVSASAFPHRKPHHVIWISPAADDPAKDEEMIRWTRECWLALRPHVDRAVYVNAVVDDSGGTASAREVYGPNYERLQQLKQQYDPTNFLAENSNIEPALR